MYYTIRTLNTEAAKKPHKNITVQKLYVQLRLTFSGKLSKGTTLNVV